MISSVLRQFRPFFEIAADFGRTRVRKSGAIATKFGQIRPLHERFQPIPGELDQFRRDRDQSRANSANSGVGATSFVRTRQLLERLRQGSGRQFRGECRQFHRFLKDFGECQAGATNAVQTLPLLGELCRPALAHIEIGMRGAPGRARGLDRGPPQEGRHQRPEFAEFGPYSGSASISSEQRFWRTSE